MEAAAKKQRGCPQRSEQCDSSTNAKAREVNLPVRQHFSFEILL